MNSNKPPRQNLREALVRPGVWALILPSVVFESQIKLIVAYLQPAVAEGTVALNLPVLGTGALVVGVYMAAYGLFAGGASLLSSRVASWSGGVEFGLRRLHLTVAAVVTIATITLHFGFPTVGLVTLLSVGALQNARRPLFVTCLDDVMAPEYRATVLSVESQGRSWVYAGTSIGLGMLTDTFGLAATFSTMALLLWLVVLVDNRGQANPSSL